MDARTVDASGHGAPAQGAPRPRRSLRSASWLRGGDDGGEQLVEELEAELALLREENARLAIRARSAGDERPWDERLRALVPAQPRVAAAEDRSWELLTECQLLRAALVETCREAEQAMAQIRGRLEALAEPLPLPLPLPLPAAEPGADDEEGPRDEAAS